MNKKTLKDVDVKEKRVLVRVDFNVPLSGGRVADDTRIRAALPTIKHLIDEKARIILMSHLGRPGGEPDEDLRMDPVAQSLANILSEEAEQYHSIVRKVDSCTGDEPRGVVEGMGAGDILLLENTRFYAQEKENDPEVSRELASMADLYVNDAFGTAHRAHASTAGVAEHLPSCAGFLIQNELEILGKALEAPESPFGPVLGGAKVSDKIGVIENLLDRVDVLIIGGGMANTFIRARGYEVGNSLVEEDKVQLARELMKKADEEGVEFLLPKDLVVASDFAADAEYRTVGLDGVPDGWQILDIGPKSRELFAAELERARTVVWNGPMGVFELEPFAAGTEAVARALAESEAISIIGGGDSAAAVKKLGLEDRMTHISTGGGASLTFLEGGELPGIEALDDA